MVKLQTQAKLVVHVMGILQQAARLPRSRRADSAAHEIRPLKSSISAILHRISWSVPKRFYIWTKQFMEV